MPAATRLLVAFVLLVCAFVVLVGVAVFSLAMAGQGMLAGVVATAGLIGVAAGGMTYWFLWRESAEAEVEFELEPLVPAAQPVLAAPHSKPGTRRGPLRVQAMPVADLPQEYVDAVMRGARAHLSALKAQDRLH
jgi:hypothetical protein